MALTEATGMSLLAGMLDQCRIVTGKDFKLAAHDPHPAVPADLEKGDAKALMAAGVARLAVLQDLLYANASWSLLVVIQAMDAAGKDGTIKHVMSGVNPQGVAVTTFKAPGPEDLAHDFLWRPVKALPARGMIGLFNRSYYEDVLVPRVHPEALSRQRLPASLAGSPGFWDGRLDDIAGFECHLNREGTRIVKLFLNVSRDEQKRRLLARLDEPDKLWKFDDGDLGERRHWDDYMAAYQAAIAATATEAAPWYVIPADRKWLMRLLTMQAVIGALEALDLEPMKPAPEKLAVFAEARLRLKGDA